MLYSPDKPPTVASKPRTTPVDAAATARWENEGGGVPVPTKPVTGSTGPTASGATIAAATTPPTATPTSTPTATPALDARQDTIMTATSADGRPPPRWMRLAGWRWVALGALLILAGIIALIAIRGISTQSVFLGLGLGVLLLLGASPVLGAGLMRGSEERAARRNARLEQRVRRNHSSDAGYRPPTI